MDPVARVQKNLDDADEGNYGVSAWYFYMNRRDIESILGMARRTRAAEEGLALLERKAQGAPGCRARGKCSCAPVSAP